jgi:hypothetical protein
MSTLMVFDFTITNMRSISTFASLSKLPVCLLGFFLLINPVFAEIKGLDFWNAPDPCPSWLSKGAAATPPPNQPLEVTISPYTFHWSRSPEHKTVVLGSLDRTVQGNRLCGMSFFTNSFGQPTVYVYVGQRWNPIEANKKFFVKVTSGILYGYVGQYKDKVPLNHGGFSPAIIPSLGYSINGQDSLQVLPLGNAGIMFAYGHRF